MKYYLLLILILATSTQSFAVNYSIPADIKKGAFAGCTTYGTNAMQCPVNLELKQNDTVTFTQDFTWNNSGNLIISGNNVVINPGNAVNLTMNLSGNFIAGSPNNLTVNANLTISGNLDAGQNLVWVGNINSTANMTFAKNTNITGNISANGSINFGNNSSVVGTCSGSGGNYPTYCAPANVLTPILEYRFDETLWQGVSNEVQDSTVNLRHATADASTNTSTSSDAVMCRSANFNGGNKFLTSNHLATLRSTATMSFWIKTTQTGNSVAWSSPGIAGIEETGGSDDIFWGWLNNNGRIGVTVGNFNSSYSTVAVNDNVFHHVVLVRDAATDSYRIYIDGVDRTNGAGAYTDSGIADTIGNVFNTIGRVDKTNGSTPAYLNALIDELLIFDTPLTAAQATKIYNLQSTGKNLDGSTRDCTPPPPSTCFTDSFDGTNLSSNWALSSNSGSFGLPKIVNNRLRITDNTGNVSTAATLFKLFPSANNRVVVEFDYYAYGGGTGGADGVALVFSDSNITPQPGGYGGSLGYAPKGSIVGFHGGWMGIGIDEFGNFLNLTDGNKNGGFTTRVRETITIRGSGTGTTGYNYITSNGQVPGSGTLPTSLNPTVQTTSTVPHRYRVSIDHENGTNAFVTVERNTGSGYVKVINTFDLLAQTGQTAIPQKMYLTITGSTGGSVNNHEIDNLKVCANVIEPAYFVDHYELDRDFSQGLTCEALNIKSRACLNASCTTQVADPVTTTFTPTTGWQSGNTKTNYTSGASFKFQQITPGAYTLGVSSSSPSIKPLATQPVQCFVAGAVQTNCTVNFVDAAFRFFTTAAPNTAVSSYSMVAGQKLNNLLMRAVATNPATGQCQTFLSSGGPVSSQLGTVCSNPATCVVNQRVSWEQGSATALANPQNLSSGSTTSTANLSFNSNSETYFSLTSPDVGLQPLTVSTVNFKDVNGNGSGKNVSGSVNLNVSPASLRITNVRNATGVVNNSTNAFAKAGENFKTTLEALDINGNTVPSFGRITGLHNVSWTDSTLQAPAGGVLGTITGDSAGASSAAQWQGFDADSNGSLESMIFSGANGIRYSEVGNLNLRASINNFMNFGTKITSPPVNVGRFTPAYLQVTEVNPNTATWGTSSAIYQGQSNSISGLSYDVVAYDANNQPLKNYVGPYATFANKTNALTKPTAQSTTGGTLNSQLAWTKSNDSDFDGSIRLTATISNVDWTRNLAGPTTADSLQNVTSLLLSASALTDADGICVKATAAGSCLTTTADVADRSLYYGRLKLPQQVTAADNIAYVPATLEYLSGFNGSGEALFSTQISESFFNSSVINGLQYNGELCTVSGCQPTGTALSPVSLTGPTGTGTTLNAGQGNIRYAPSSQLTGLLSADARIPNWLTWYWDGDKNGNGTLEPSELTASSTMLLFGDYQGRAPLLFVRPGFR